LGHRTTRETDLTADILCEVFETAQIKIKLMTRRDQDEGGTQIDTDADEPADAAD
jgi:hypothetical protein